MLPGIGQESNLPGAFDRNRHTSLVSGAQATLPARIDFPAIANKAAQLVVSFPINDFIFISAEDTNFAAGLKTSPARSAPRLLLTV
jgi:hypothetical protein